MPEDGHMDEQLTTTPLEVVERIYEAMAAKDLDVILRLFSPDIVITQDRALPWGGRYEGLDELGRFSTTIRGLIESKVTVLAMFEAGDRVVQYGRTAGTVRATGATFDIPECHIWRIENGQAVEANYFIDTPAMLTVLSAEG
jgi:ketosteroid isomerase-like protein